VFNTTDGREEIGQQARIEADGRGREEELE
jgi:hypothetical protein